MVCDWSVIGLTKMVIGCDWFVIGFVIVIGGDCDFCDLVLGFPEKTLNSNKNP